MAGMGYRTIEYKLSDRVAWIWLDRPAKRNALDLRMMQEITDVTAQLNKNAQADALVIRGKGDVFCAGADLSLMRELEKKTKRELEKEAGFFFDLYQGLYNLEIPLVTYVHGAVRGGGNGIPAVSDIVLAETNAVFAFSEVRLGLIPATVAPFVVRKIGIMNARKIMATAMEFDAGEALRMGMADRVIMHEQSDYVIEGILSGIHENGPSAVRRTKRMVTGMGDSEFNENIRRSAISLQVESRKSPEAAEGISAFFGKRQPLWTRKHKL